MFVFMLNKISSHLSRWPQVVNLCPMNSVFSPPLAVRDRPICNVHLNSRPNVPINIQYNKPNSIISWRFLTYIEINFVRTIGPKVSKSKFGKYDSGLLVTMFVQCSSGLLWSFSSTMHQRRFYYDQYLIFKNLSNFST